MQRFVFSREVTHSKLLLMVNKATKKTANQAVLSDLSTRIADSHRQLYKKNPLLRIQFLLIGTGVQSEKLRSGYTSFRLRRPKSSRFIEIFGKKKYGYAKECVCRLILPTDSLIVSDPIPISKRHQNLPVRQQITKQFANSEILWIQRAHHENSEKPKLHPPQARRLPSNGNPMQSDKEIVRRTNTFR